MLNNVPLRTAARQHRHHLLWLLSTLLLLLSAVRIVGAMVSTPTPSLTLPPSPNVESLTDNPRALPETLFNEKNGWSPFAVTEMTPADPRLRSAPPSTLPFKVNGILYQASQRNSLAILSSGSQQFTVGKDELLEGSKARVAHIFPDRVIIINRGHYEALILEQDSRR